MAVQANWGAPVEFKAVRVASNHTVGKDLHKVGMLPVHLPFCVCLCVHAYACAHAHVCVYAHACVPVLCGVCPSLLRLKPLP